MSQLCRSVNGYSWRVLLLTQINFKRIAEYLPSGEWAYTAIFPWNRMIPEATAALIAPVDGPHGAIVH